VALRPEFAVAWNDLGILLAQHDRYREAQACYRKALELEPGRELWRLNSIALCPSEFDTNEELDAYRHRLLAELESFAKRKITFQPAELLTSNCRPSFNLQFHGRDERPLRQAYARVFEPSFPAGHVAAATGRPRIGLVVTDWHELGFLRSLGGVLDRIDTGWFDVVIFGSARGQEILRAGLRNQAIRVLGIPTQFEQFVTAIRAASVDLLYYWEVGTDNTNYFLPFLRLAPVQCTSWGIQVTSGIPTLDYYLSSTLAEPDDVQAHYSERLILAETLLTFQRRAELPHLPRPREHFGLSADQHLYLCAQQLGKFQPDFDPILEGILRRDSRGVIVVTEDRRGTFMSQDLRRRFAATLGDVVDRIVFVPYQAGDDYLSLVAAADVLLDPLHFGGVNSTYDGFSLSKPIVTLPSSFQRGRYTLACYRKMGLLDCVARDADDYIDIAVRLGTNADYRGQITAAIGRASVVLFEDIEAVHEHERIFAELAGRARSAT
jgi:predicted O-linked N-acetylglucosamine transferase (SPINDLY family)